MRELSRAGEGATAGKKRGGKTSTPKAEEGNVHSIGWGWIKKLFNKKQTQIEKEKGKRRNGQDPSEPGEKQLKPRQTGFLLFIVHRLEMTTESEKGDSAWGGGGGYVKTLWRTGRHRGGANPE